MAVNLSKNRLALLTAYQDVINENSATDWALYTYEGDSNDLTLASSGDGGLSEIAGTFDNTCVMYGFCSLKEPTAALPRYILINWVGEDVPDARKCACASHVATIAEFFQVSEGVDVIINASSAEDIEPSAIGQRLTNGTVPVASPVLSRLRMRDEEHGENVGTSYQKTNAEIEMKKINREEFWEQAKREEEMRKEEERKKAAEERQKFEEERMELERKEQEEREKRYREREQQIEEHRKKLQDEEEARERTRNQTLITVESCEDSAQDKRESEVEEAAAIIAQRSENPRDFFKQKERAVASGVDSSPVPTQRTAPESEQRAPVQESAQSKPTQSVAPQARVTNASPSDHPFQQEADSQLDLWETSGPPAGTAPLQTAHLVDLMGDSPEPSTAGAAPALPQPLLSFDELPEPPDASGPQMTLSYQHALQHASGSGSQDLDDGQLLMTNGEMLLKEGTQASEGYFSQSQEEEFAQSEECSAKVTPSPVFYNKPPEIDITCWDTDPVMEDDD
ncbi:drebrin isoform X5 [Megalops cyprinoides]|uniref:drebrin isoform X5 n=1 Tax=Megalops cyprinoides TaxID=118141 RepID=UPI0018643684|nr:drebrin isoform X5 [Megalops cyprinoides]